MKIWPEGWRGNSAVKGAVGCEIVGASLRPWRQADSQGSRYVRRYL